MARASSPNPPADGPICCATVNKSARRPREFDREVAQIAEAQYGLVALWQMEHLGLGRSAVSRRVDDGRLHRVRQGVFAVGHSLLTRHGEFRAAVLACGPGAVLSHRTAAELWGIRDDRRRSIDVTAPGRRGRCPSGVDAHRDGALSPGDRAELHGIPCTSLPKTLLDLAALVPVWELRRAISEAEVRRVLDHSAMRRLIRRSRGRRGVARLRLLLDEIHPETKRTRSELERMFLRMCTRAKLPQPEVNVKLAVENGRREVDFLWRDARLVIEADSRRFHDTDSAYLSDRRKEQRLQLAGWRVSRCTWEQVEYEPAVLARIIQGLLAQA